MNLRAPLLVLVLACLAACQPAADRPQAATPPSQTEQTRALALPFLQRMFIARDVRGAYSAFAAEDFIQHNPLIANGLAGHRAYFAELAQRPQGNPKAWAHVTDMVLVQDDLFALLHRRYKGPGDPGQIFADIWRVEDGKIAEHWDVIQDMPRAMPHDNGMGCGPVRSYEQALAHKDSIRQPSCGLPSGQTTGAASIATYLGYVGEVANGDVLGAIERWFHPGYRQHSPVIADGKAGAIAYLSQEWGRPGAPLPKLGPQRIVAEGDLVLVHYMFSFEGVAGEEAHVDIFRATAGKISEHWDLKQPVPANPRNANGMW